MLPARFHLVRAFNEALMYQSDTKQSSVGLEAILITLLVSAAGKSLKKYAKFNQFFPETALKSPVNTYTKKVVY